MPLSPELHQEAINLAKRSRLGDQNATGMIEEIEKNARLGVPQAVLSHPVIVKYFRENPILGALGVDDRTAHVLSRLAECFVPPWIGVVAVFSEMADMGEDAMCGASALLAGECDITPELITHFLQAWPSGVRGAMEHGLTFAGEPELEKANVSDPVARGALCAGHVLGTARRWQEVRRGARPSFLSPNVGWELE